MPIRWARLSAAVLSGALLAVSSLASPAQAGSLIPAALAGALSITVPPSASLGAAAPGVTISGQLGTIQVSDTLGTQPSWTATVSATNFTTGAGGVGRTVDTTQFSYWSGPATATTGAGTRVPGQLTAAQAQHLIGTRTAFSKTSGTAVNTTSWNPTLIVTIPLSVIAGPYQATITHTVL